MSTQFALNDRSAWAAAELKNRNDPVHYRPHGIDSSEYEIFVALDG